mgnify:CR=1 FL=1
MIDLTYLIPYLNKITQDGYFYNPSKMLTYKRPFNVMQTSRSVGKTTIFGCVVLLNYLIKGKQFVYVRRTDTETLDGARDFFIDAVDIIREYYPEFNLISAYYEANKFYAEIGGNEDIEKVEIGRTMPLSFVGKRKSVRPKDANVIIFDEFVAMYQKEYLGTADNLTEEYDRLIILYQSIDRGKGQAFKNDTAIFCLGNSTTLFNPIFLGLNCLKYIQKESKFIAPKKAFYIIERVERVPATEEIEKSFAYQMTSETERQKMYHNDTGEFTGRYIADKPKKSQPLCNFTLAGKTNCLYYSEYKMVYFIGARCNDYEIRHYSLDIDGHEMTDTELVYAMKDFIYSNNLRASYQHGRLLFQNMETQRRILSYLKIS